MSKPDSNTFSHSHDHKTSFSMGELVPIHVNEVLPGDKFHINTENLLRFAPLISPVMHRVRVTTHFFFVPNRILWPEFQKWITGDSEVEHPYVNVNAGLPGTLGDYMGIPTETFGQPQKINPLPFAAYAKIYDEYYRDQNLQTTEFFEELVPGNNSSAYGSKINGDLKRRAWMHDYFTSCLPWAQKGDSVVLPLVDQNSVPVEVIKDDNPGIIRSTNGGDPSAPGDVVVTTGPVPLLSSMAVGTDKAFYDPNGTLGVDIQADAVDINTVRRAFRLQEWLEKNARAGTRYVENILAHFGVRSSDARLQRPELIGTSRQNMVISEVLSTAQSDNDPETANVPVGQMAGHGISVGGGKGFNYHAEEHGFIIGIMSVTPDTAYSQGIHRMFQRFDRFDYAWPLFANIGEQPVKTVELYAAADEPEATFGYIPRYSEYKFRNSMITGEMRDSLAFWHLGRKFATPPALNAQFIECNPSTDIFAVTDPGTDHIYAHIFFDIRVRRKLPRYDVPTI